MDLASELAEAALARAAAVPLPEATYRLQFHAKFTFADARPIVPYLAELGVTHAYASPYFKAAAGSTHGYDVVDHNALNPEVGTEADYTAWVEALRRAGLAHILDTVPNHVGVATNDNAWWNDVLEGGPASRCGRYFDINWDNPCRPELRGKVLLPVLGDAYGTVLENGELQLHFDHGAFAIGYYDRRFPLSPQTYAEVLGCEANIGKDETFAEEFRNIACGFAVPPEPIAGNASEVEALKRRLAALAEASPSVRAHVDSRLASLNGKKGDPSSFDALDALLNRQHYRLAFWRVAPQEINYRRFFDINDLAALRMERADVFEAAHRLALRLLTGGELAGLRSDHPDGLHDPGAYFDRLQEHYVTALASMIAVSDERYRAVDPGLVRLAVKDRLSEAPAGSPAARPLYVVAEKILAADEPLRDGWRVHGTTGYDFLTTVNGLFVDPAGEAPLADFYRELLGHEVAWHDLIYEKKRAALATMFAGDLASLAGRLDRLAQSDRRSRDFTLSDLHAALRELIASFPVYRTYICNPAVEDADRERVDAAIQRAAARNPKMRPALFDFVRDTLLLVGKGNVTARCAFVGKFQQLSAPVTAKGVEDTSFYLYNRLVSLNEVGGEPDHFGVAPAAAHAYLQDRQQKWPHALSPLSTHDTKRGEDVRARLNVLSELPGEWREQVLRWRELNAPLIGRANDAPAPDANDEYLIYQTLLGAWPMEPYRPDEYADFIKRVCAYLQKAMREAKAHTTWTDPNVDYEKAVEAFITAILDPSRSGAFLDRFRPFQRRVSHLGVFNSLAQTIVRLTAPGAPDTYQGTELWNLSLVDPDNRRPVDYGLCRQMLRDLRGRAESSDDRRPLASELLKSPADGRVKLYVTWLALTARRENPGLFSRGEYVPLKAEGPAADHVFAFGRRHENREAIVVVPRFVASLLREPTGLPLGQECWGETVLRVPANRPVRNLLTGEAITPHDGTLRLADVFATFPGAICLPA